MASLNLLERGDLMLTRMKSKGRRGGEKEPFAMLPESVLQHPALATAPHAALRVLTVLLVGKSRERNGTMMCSDSYAARFGITSHDTLTRSLELLQQRGLIVITRRVQRMRRFAALYAVTWWPIFYRDGQPITTPEPATHGYRDWTELDRSPRLSGDHAPTIGVMEAGHHPDLPPNSTNHHPDYRGNSENLGQGVDIDGRIGKLITMQPHLTDGDVARAARTDIERVTRVRARLAAEEFRA